MQKHFIVYGTAPYMLNAVGSTEVYLFADRKYTFMSHPIHKGAPTGFFGQVATG